MSKNVLGVAIVTGASSGIGEATAELLANSGYKVYGTSRKGAQTTQRSYKMIALDVNNEESIEAALRLESKNYFMCADYYKY